MPFRISTPGPRTHVAWRSVVFAGTTQKHTAKISATALESAFELLQPFVDGSCIARRLHRRPRVTVANEHRAKKLVVGLSVSVLQPNLQFSDPSGGFELEPASLLSVLQCVSQIRFGEREKKVPVASSVLKQDA